MYTIHFVVSCPCELTEVVPDELDSAACMIEERFTLALLEFFIAVNVEVVEVVFTPTAVTAEEIHGDLLPPAA